MSGLEPAGPKRKKACPGKSRPLLTYEKHQAQISLFNHPPIKLIGELGKCWGLLRISPALHLPPLNFTRDKLIKILFCFKEFIDLGRWNCLHKFHTVFLLYVQQGLFQFQFVLVGTVYCVRLSYFTGIKSIDRPEFLSFLRSEKEPISDKTDLICFETPGIRLPWRRPHLGMRRYSQPREDHEYGK